MTTLPTPPAAPPTPAAPVDEEKLVTRGQRFVLSAVFVLAAIFFLYCLIKIWPSDGKAPAITTDVMFGWTWTLSSDQHIVMLVILAGALGGVLSSLLKMQKYAGEGRLKWSWMLSYVVLPVSGALVAVTLYTVIRADFVNFNTDAAKIDVYGYMAVGFLSGLFANNVIQQLRTVAESLFEKESGDNESGTPGGDVVKTPAATTPAGASTAGGAASEPAVNTAGIVMYPTNLPPLPPSLVPDPPT